ncbi:MAG: putative lipid II flippase FtsW [Desulfuromonadales bacterium]|nr:putative lipid II flippase FtsW [Desulfuromonadales bacterium]
MEIRQGTDHSILLLAVCLTCLGVVMVFSSSSIMAVRDYGDSLFFLKRQGAYALLGFGVMVLLMRVNLEILRKAAWPILAICVLLLVAVLIPGVGKKVGGAARWIRVAGFTFQPAEFAKIGLILFMAHSLARKQEKIRSFRFGLLPYLLILAVLLGLLLAQPDLGSALTLGVVAIAMLMVAGTRITYLASLGLAALPFLYFMVMNVDYRRRRILAFLNPWDDPSNTGFQIIQSWIAFGSGGTFGKGLGESKQKLFFLPEAHTDFIFSVIGEELGYIGVIVIAAMFMLLVMRGLRTALNAPNQFTCFLAFGVTLLIGLEALVNMAVVMGMVPTKGLALPLISYGGTSLVTTLAAIGILLNVSRQLPGELR